jgi:PAS domain S-box-containing protein
VTSLSHIRGHPYIVALAATAAATSVRLLLDPFPGFSPTLAPYYVAILASGLFGGSVAASFSLIAGLVIEILVGAGSGALDHRHIGDILVYVMVGSVMAWLTRQQDEAQLRGRAATLAVAKELDERRRVEHALDERVKELKTLHDFAQLLLNQDMSVSALLQTVVTMLPAGWQYPDITVARIVYRGHLFTSRPFHDVPALQRADFHLRDGTSGTIEVGYLEDRSNGTEGPFLPEERHLINSLAEMLKAALERRIAKAALVRSIEKYQSLVTNIPDVIWTADSDGQTTYISPSVERVYGFTAEEICAGGPDIWMGRIHPDDLGRVRQAYSRLFHQKRRFEVEYRIQHKNGRWIWLQDRSVMTYEVNGKCYTDGIFRDITEAKQAALALQELNETLEAQVQERTKALLLKQQELSGLAVELSRTEARERKKLATDLHDNLAQLLALSKIKLGSALRDERDRPNVYREVKALLDGALRYTRTLMADLGPPLLGSDDDLQRAIAWVVEKMHRHGLHVTVHDKDGRKVLSEEALTVTYQVVQELLFNVVKHAQCGQATVTLERCGEDLKVVVTDEGVGFDVSAARKPSHDGGFGLLNIQQRVTAFGGRIDIASEPGRGTCAMLFMPLLRPAIETAEQQEARQDVAAGEGAVAAASHRSATIRILLVDDHPVLRQGMRSVLEQQPGLEVVGEAGDGAAAIECVRQCRPAVVLMDINMPIMSGIDATRLILSEYPHTVIIGLSMHEDPAMARAMLEAGAAEYLTKGGSFEDLLRAMTRHVHDPQEPLAKPVN